MEQIIHTTTTDIDKSTDIESTDIESTDDKSTSTDFDFDYRGVYIPDDDYTPDTDDDNEEYIYENIFDQKYSEFINKEIEDIDQLPKELVGEWNFISQCFCLTPAFIEKYHDKINWHYIGQYQIIPDALIVKFIDKIDVLRIIQFQNNLNRDCIAEEVEDLIRKQILEKLNKEKVTGWVDMKIANKDIGKFSVSAAKLYNFTRAYFSSEDQYKLTKLLLKKYYLKEVTTENVYGEIISICHDDNLLDLSNAIIEKLWLRDPEIFKLFEDNNEYYEYYERCKEIEKILNDFKNELKLN